jgi:hypothetical protein
MDMSLGRFGDRRLDKGGATLLERMVQEGHACLRRLAAGAREVEVQFNRFLANPRVTVAKLIAGWSEETAPAAAGRHVLAIQDTSEINFQTSTDRNRGLGLIGKGVGRGILLHPMIAVDAVSQECLGLVGGTIWTREIVPIVKRKNGKKKKKNNGKKSLEDKESYRWLETAQSAKKTLSSAAMVTMIADREADIYQLWTSIPDKNIHVLGRVYHDRVLDDGKTITTAAQSWPILGTRKITIREREDRSERVATLVLRTGTITIPRPVSAREKGLPDSVILTMIELNEINAPDGVEPLLWRLLTSHTVNDAEMAWKIVDWYRMRWIIEQFFRLLKQQGLRVEDSQICTAERLLKIVAISARSAIVILQMLQARDGHSSMTAPFIFDPSEMATLEALDKSYAGKTKLQQNPHSHRSLAWASWIIARLGGWDAYPSSRPPGPITFKNGLDALRKMAQGWALRDVCMP